MTLLARAQTTWRRAITTKFTPPTFPGDELKTRRAALLNIGLVGASMFYLFALCIPLFQPNLSPFVLPLLALSLAACVLLYAALQRGHVSIAALGIVILSLAGATFTAALIGTFHHAAMAGYLAIVVLAGLLFNRRGIYLTAAACSLSSLVLLAVENVRALGVPAGASDPVEWLLFTGLLFFVGALVSFSAQLVHFSLASANQELAERKRAQTVLQDSEERYHRLVASAQDVIYRMSLPDGKYEYVSPAAVQVFGYTPEEFYATPMLVSRIIHPAWREYLQAEWKNLLNGNMSPTYEYQIVTRSGSVHWIFQRNVLVRDAQGTPIAIEGIATDITRRKRAENVTEARSRLLEKSFAESWTEILQSVLDEAEELTGSSIGFLHFLEADQTTLVLQNWSSRTKQEFCRAEGAGLHYPVDRAGVWADCVRERRPIICNSYQALPHRRGMPPGHAVVERFISVPLFRAEHIVGIIGVGNALYDYTSQDVEQVEELANLSWDIVERKRTEDQLQYVSTHDALTGICNRAFFETELKRLDNSREYPISIIVADLDNLKFINDTYGHAVGDLMLQRAASAFGSAFRASDILARIGGDEFALVLPRTDVKTASEILARVRTNLAAHNAAQQGIPLCLSVGVATSEDGALLETLSRADAQMYAEKRSHKTNAAA